MLSHDAVTPDVFTPVAQQPNAELLYEVRVADTRLLGKGKTSGLPYYDVVVTRQPNSGILIKLDYTRRNTTFSFDLHHRLSLDPAFAYPADIITTVEVLSGGTTSIGTFTIIDTIKSGDVFEEAIDKVSKADVDRYVTPFGKKTITMKLGSGSQSHQYRRAIRDRDSRRQRPRESIPPASASPSFPTSNIRKTGPAPCSRSIRRSGSNAPPVDRLRSPVLPRTPTRIWRCVSSLSRPDVPEAHSPAESTSCRGRSRKHFRD